MFEKNVKHRANDASNDVIAHPYLVLKVASVASVPLLEGALRKASVFPLLLCDHVGDTGTVDHPLGQAVALHGA